MTEKSEVTIAAGAGFIFALAVPFFLAGAKVTVFALAAALLHEFGHIAAIYICGGRVSGVRLSACGATMTPAELPMISYAAEILVSAAGPAVNIMCAFCAALAAEVLGTELYLFAGVCLVLAAYNLVPAFPLDGGRALYFFLCIFFNPDTAYGIVRALSAAAGVTLAGACIVFFTLGAVNVTLYIAVAPVIYAMIRGRG